MEMGSVANGGRTHRRNGTSGTATIESWPRFRPPGIQRWTNEPGTAIMLSLTGCSFCVFDRLNPMSARRTVLKSALGTAAFASLLQRDGIAATGATHFAPKAKRVVYLFQSGGPSHLELLDEKPELQRLQGTELPDSIRQGQRLTGMTSGQSSFPVVASKFGFHSCGQSGTRISDLLPHTGSVVDDICIVKSMYTEAINHDPAITFIQTGSQQPGRPSLGAWASYGLGSEAEDLAGISGFDFTRQRQRLESRIVGTTVGQRVSAVQPSRREAPQSGRSGTVSFRSARASIADCDVRCWTALRSSINEQLASPVIPKSQRASRNMKWHSACSHQCRNSPI